MLTIRHEQYDALARDHRERFHREVLDVLKETMPAATDGRPDSELLARIAAAHARADGRGINMKEDVAKFAALDLGLGPQFDREPRIHAYLQRDDLDMTTKLDTFCRRLSVRLRTA